MNRIVILAVAVLVLAGVAGFVLSSNKKPTPQPSPTDVIQETTTPEPLISDTPTPSPCSIDLENNPVLKALPHSNNYWYVDCLGKDRGDKILVRAGVYYKPGENTQDKINQQKPFIDAYLKGTQQPDDSYTVRYEAVPYPNFNQ